MSRAVQISKIERKDGLVFPSSIRLINAPSYPALAAKAYLSLSARALPNIAHFDRADRPWVPSLHSGAERPAEAGGA